MISFEFIRDNYDELEADFQREYGIDLGQALWGDNALGVRRISALINGLSPDCATVRKVNTAGSKWGPLEELLAVIAEQIDMTNQLLYQAHFDSKTKWTPLRIHRPYGPPEEHLPTVSSELDQITFFAGTGVTVWDPEGRDEDAEVRDADLHP